MKKSLSLIALMAIIGTGSAFGADSLSEAFKNGTFSGDISATYESRDLKGGNGAYSVGSTGLNFETAMYKNFSLGIGARLYTKLWEQNDNDSQGWLETNKASAIAVNTFLAYTTDIAKIKIGRQVLDTEWMTNDHDAISAYITPFEKAELELIYSQKRGNIGARDLIIPVDSNANKGVYKAGLTYAFSDAINTNAYYMNASDAYDLYGAKANVNTMVNDVEIGGYAHYMSIDTEGSNENGVMIDAQAYVGLSGWYGYLGYTDNKNGALGSVSGLGDKIVQFEEGDQMYGPGDNTTLYAMINKNFAGVDLTAIYGKTDYNEGVADYSKSEFDIWVGYSFRDDFRADLGFTNTFEDDADAFTNDLTQVNLTFTYIY